MGNVLKVIHSESCKVFLTTIVHLLESWGTATLLNAINTFSSQGRRLAKRCFFVFEVIFVRASSSSRKRWNSSSSWRPIAEKVAKAVLLLRRESAESSSSLETDSWIRLPNRCSSSPLLRILPRSTEWSWRSSARWIKFFLLRPGGWQLDKVGKAVLLLLLAVALLTQSCVCWLFRWHKLCMLIIPNNFLKGQIGEYPCTIFRWS